MVVFQMIHTRKELVEKVKGLQTYIENKEGFLIRKEELAQVEQFISEIISALPETNKK